MKTYANGTRPLVVSGQPEINSTHMAEHLTGLGKIWSVNEWGRLRAVIVGNPRGAIIPSMNDVSQQSFDRPAHSDHLAVVSQPMPSWIIEETEEDIEGLVQTLTANGVQVHRAAHVDSTVPIRTSLWQADQETAINIRDMTLIHGNVVIDAPSPTRGRYCEGFAVRDIFNEFRRSSNGVWFVAPHRPRLHDRTYDLSRSCGIKEIEPLFDAANCVRLGRDIIIDINNTANRAGAAWIQETLNKHFGSGVVTVHCVSLSPDHIDVVIVPLCEGRALINPHYVRDHELPACLKGWDLIPAPEMVPQSFHGTPKASNWIGLNLLVLDGVERTVIVERRQEPLLRLLEQHGFRPIPVQWRHGRTWGGGFHCVTLDVQRDGSL